ncbi:hypothetical protein GCM10017612_48210 [Novosphingobium resinovorum]|nr:hypothetical protein GCM10017612_48210 [Novosphingobium resinovorum]
MSGGTISRGHPLLALLALLGGWVGGRAATWEPAVSNAAPAALAATQGGAVFQSLPGYADFEPQAPQAAPYAAPNVPLVRYAVTYPAAVGLAPSSGADEASDFPHLRKDFAALQPLPRFYAPEGSGGVATSPAADLPMAPQRPRRWSMDAWTLMRRDSGIAPASVGALPGTYGASQAGGILRYRLALASPHRPTAYLRSTSTTGRIRETMAAVGLSARPFAAFPVIAALEGRMTDQMGQRRVQGAAMAITELPPFPLPAGFRAEAYGQAGYVAGRYATPFADGQFRADRGLLTLGAADMRIGGGLWGGAQKGAARLDAGPTTAITMPIGRGINGRVAVDWRFRLAGDAVPGSGPALTLSAGF